MDKVHKDSVKKRHCYKCLGTGYIMKIVNKQHITAICMHCNGTGDEDYDTRRYKDILK